MTQVADPGYTRMVAYLGGYEPQYVRNYMSKLNVPHSHMSDAAVRETLARKFIDKGWTVEALRYSHASPSKHSTYTPGNTAALASPPKQYITPYANRTSGVISPTRRHGYGASADVGTTSPTKYHGTMSTNPNRYHGYEPARRSPTRQHTYETMPTNPNRYHNVGSTSPTKYRPGAAPLVVAPSATVVGQLKAGGGGYTSPTRYHSTMPTNPDRNGGYTSPTRTGSMSPFRR